MGRFITIFSILFCSTFLYAQTNSKHVYVSPHTRKDGTYVQGYYKTSPNSTNRDNFSTKGNTNPYTGEAGYIEPDNKTNNSTYYTPSTNSTNSTNTYNYSNTNSTKYAGTTNSYGEKVITYSDGQEVFGLCYSCNDIIYNDKLDYYWYTEYSGVQKTTGGSGGKLLNGEYKFYNEKGQLIVKANYKRGLEDGDYTSWNEEGKIKEKLHYLNGVSNYAKYTNEDGYIIEWVGEIFKNGSVKNVYTSNENLVETSIIDEKYRFHYKTYYEWSKQLKEEYTWGIGDFYYGDFKSYYENGNPKILGKFKDNFQVGDWKYFNEDSTISSIDKYKLYIENYPNGNLKIKGSQYYDTDEKKWVRSRKWIFYKENGKDWDDVKFYEHGIEVEEKKD